MELTILEADSRFVCPDERAPISRAVHAARLAAGYEACRRCDHRLETGLLPRQISEQTRARFERKEVPLFSPSGIRGVSINSLTRERMGQLTLHVLAQYDADHDDEHGPGPIRVLTGYDSRASSPDLAIGVVSALRRSGCIILDAGQVSRPEFDLALDRFRPHLGIYVTGGNQPHSWNGLDILSSRAMPWCFPGKLEQLAKRWKQTPSRRSRTQGEYAEVSLRDDYERLLADQFHALRPLRVAVASPDPVLRSRIRNLLEQTSCQVLMVPGTLFSDDAKKSSRSLVDALCERRQDVGFFIGQDGRSCRVYDEGGYELSLSETMLMLGRLVPSSGPQRFLIQSECSPEECDSEADFNSDEELSEDFTKVLGTEADLLHMQQETQSLLAADRHHRFWFLGESPACDAIQTLARVLEVMSQSERPVSSYRQPRRRRLRSRS